MRIIDMHCDTIMALMNTDKNIYESDNMIDIKKLNILANIFNKPKSAISWVTNGFPASGCQTNVIPASVT